MEGSHQIYDPSEPDNFRPYVSKDGDGIAKAGKLLAQFIDPNYLPDRDVEPPQRPLVNIAFDEAHILTDNPPIMNRTTKWTLFSDIMNSSGLFQGCGRESEP